MTLRLILMRHAKSSWGDGSLDDHDRPLNPRGRRSAAAIGDWLQARGSVPDLVLSSDAARTRETYKLLSERWDAAPQVQWVPDLYLAPVGTMKRVLEAATGASVLVLGHNPGIAGFAGMLAQTSPRHPRFSDYPTAATAVFEFEAATFRDADWGMGRVVDFVVPRDLGVN